MNEIESPEAAKERIETTIAIDRFIALQNRIYLDYTKELEEKMLARFRLPPELVRGDPNGCTTMLRL
jgi:hypothetical protein